MAQWQPPDFAKEVWKPPDFASPIEESKSEDKPVSKESVRQAIGFTPGIVQEKGAPEKGFLQSLGESMFQSSAHPQSLGDILGLMLPNVPEGIMSYLGLARKGAVEDSMLANRLKGIGDQIVDPLPSQIPKPQLALQSSPVKGLLGPANSNVNPRELPSSELWPSIQRDIIAGPSGTGGRGSLPVGNQMPPLDIQAQTAGMVQGKRPNFLANSYKGNIGKPDLPYELPTVGEKPFVSDYPKLNGPVVDITPTNAPNILNIIKQMKTDGELNFNVLENVKQSTAKSQALKPGEKVSILNELTNVTKSMMASIDVSAPLRQGLPLIHKKEWWTSLDDMMKSLVSEKNYSTLMQTIESKPTYDLAKKSGLSLTSLDDLASREEAYMSKWAEKIPGVRASERAYVGFLNKLRSDTFDSLITSAEKSGRELTPELTRSIAKYINVSTGRGSLGSLEKAAVELNYAFFSPRMISSRLTMMNPAYYIKADPFVRKEALKSLFALATAGETVSELGRLAGGTVNNDPTNPDFQKVKIGNTRLDPYGGFQQYIVAASRLMSGKSTSSTSGKTWNMGENFVAPTRLSTVANFARSKLSPVASFAADLLQGKDFSGQPVNVSKEIADRFTPMLIQDIIGLAKEDPSLLPLGIPAALGMGLQSYNK